MKTVSKYSIVTFFILSLFISVMVQSVMLINYVVNQKEYVEQFCENKEVPDSNCHGSCHLSEQLQLNKVDLSNSIEESFSAVVSIFSFQQIKEFRPVLNRLSLKFNSFFLQSFYNDSYLNSVFKPPCYL